MKYLWAFFLLGCILETRGWRLSSLSRQTITRLDGHVGATDSVPTLNGRDGNPAMPPSKLTSKLGLLTSLSMTLQFLRPRSARAIGSLFELQTQSCVLQDVSFNVQDTSREAEMFRVLFQDTTKVLRSTSRGGSNTTTIGFGPDVYKQPASFRPGVNALFEYGGHSTVTLRGNSMLPNEDGASEVTEIFTPGTGLQFVKIGSEQLRISKGIAEGAKVSYAYGWVDLESPSGIPLEIVVGTVADPLMYSCLRVSSLKESLPFFEKSLGMTRHFVPYARQKGSNFEPQLAKDAVYLTYASAGSGTVGEDEGFPLNGSFASGSPGMGLLLVERDPKKHPPVTVGSVLDCFKIVVDVDKDLPADVTRALLEGKGGQGVLTSPDGYKFVVQPFAQFEKETRA